MFQYEQKVSVEKLKLGMYVSRLDRPWIETHFLFQGFHISNDSDMQELRRTCEYVYVDPERREAPDPESQQPAAPGRRPLSDEIFRNVPLTGVYPVVTSMDEELQSARESRAATVDQVSNILHDLKSGRKIQMESVRKAVSGMIDSIVRNPDAFLWLTRLKDKDSYAYAHCVDASSLAVAFGRHLGFAQQDLENLAIGTLLFDIGKLQLPDSLLKKPGKLTEKEYALIRRHVEFGVSVVADIEGTNKEALPQKEWVDYRMGDERQRSICPDSGHQEPMAGSRCRAECCEGGSDGTGRTASRSEVVLSELWKGIAGV
jgi:hypothetical protein